MSGPPVDVHDEGAAGAGGLHPASLMLDMPVSLWGELLRALRRAFDRVPRAELPAPLRPYAGWTPESLAAARPRKAIARAIVEDPRLREEMGAAMESQDALGAAVELDAVRLADAHGEGTAVAALVAKGRWDDLTVLAAVAAEREASRARTAADASQVRDPSHLEAARRRFSTDLAAARDERDAQRRRAEAAEERWRREDAARREDQAEIDRLRGRVAELEGKVIEERRRRDRRVAGLRRRLLEAESRLRVDDARAARVAADLERLTADLREALAPSSMEKRPVAAERVAEAALEHTVPRSVIAAVSGRPCRLPPGIGEDTPAAVQALLQVAGLETVLDGYNVTKDVRGRPHVSLPDQRHWLVKMGGAVAARYGRRLTVVFDGTEEQVATPPTARGVRVVFTSGDEIADERIGAIVEGLAADVPVLVVSSDREVREAAFALGANVVSSASFIVGAGA
ncbi:MAG TPA: NYN domain-containing protein [Egibacteraceae bacterium]|nr:NYN domain-containing protein [Egibacteraceae bacterium]